VNGRIVRLRDFDLLLLVAALGLVTLGTVLIYSGSLTQFGEPEASDLSHPVVRQVIFASVGVLLALAFARMDYRVLGTFSFGLYLAVIGMLLFVDVAGADAYGSRRWLVIGGVQVQPSELAKLVVVIMLAKYLSDRQDSVNSLRVFAGSIAIVALPAAMVFAQPDLGSSLVFAAIWLGMITVAGANWKHIAGLIATVAIALPFALLGLMTDYQRERIDLWLDPGSDPLGAGFQALQAQIGIGSGGLAGKGLTHGTQTQLEYLRTGTTDYIFSILGEELGFIGALVLFALFAVLLWRGVRAAELSRDMFGRLIAVGIVTSILLQTFINIGVNVGLLPVTGIPLPFVSQGGSSLITLFIALGILQSILLRHRPFTFRNIYS
jgi:rod shape determining protein RodA